MGWRDDYDDGPDGKPDRSYNDPWWPSVGLILFLIHAGFGCGAFIVRDPHRGFLAPVVPPPLSVAAPGPLQLHWTRRQEQLPAIGLPAPARLALLEHLPGPGPLRPSGGRQEPVLVVHPILHGRRVPD